MSKIKICVSCGDKDTEPYAKFVLKHGKPCGGKCKKCYAEHNRQKRLASGQTLKPNLVRTPEFIAELQDLYLNQKKLPQEIGRVYGVSRKTICRILDEIGVKRINGVWDGPLSHQHTGGKKERNRRWKKRAIKRCQDVVRAELQSVLKCMDCPETDWTVFTFDHRVPAEKTNDISKLMSKGKYSRLREEIPKCDVVCANCHLRRTQKMFGSWRLTDIV